MPWTCSDCQIELPDDLSTCPTCSRTKANWTIVTDRTRTFVVPAQRHFELRRGEQVAASTEPEDSVSLVPVSKISAIDKEEVRTWFEAGQHPPSGYVVFVALYPKGKTDLSVTLAVIYAGRASEELVFPREAPEDLAKDGVVYVPFLFVRGDGDLEGVSFTDTYLVDLREETEQGFAPTVEFTALKKPVQELSVIAHKRRHFVWSL